MNRRMIAWAVCALGIAASGCVNVRYSETRSVRYGGGLRVEDALASVKVEMTTDEAGRPGEIEYHIRPDEVPEAVRQAMEAKYPGGAFIGAEKEINEGRLYYELSKEIDGYEVEAMFHPDGTPHDGEIQIPEDKVPPAVRDAIAKGWPNGNVKAWERIENGAGDVVEYHVKLDDGGKAYKVAVGAGGALRGAWREIPAEIEVPVRLP